MAFAWHTNHRSRPMSNLLLTLYIPSLLRDCRSEIPNYIRCPPDVCSLTLLCTCLVLLDCAYHPAMHLTLNYDFIISVEILCSLQSLSWFLQADLGTPFTGSHFYVHALASRNVCIMIVSVCFQVRLWPPCCGQKFQLCSTMLSTGLGIGRLWLLTLWKNKRGEMTLMVEA